MWSLMWLQREKTRKLRMYDIDIRKGSSAGVMLSMEDLQRPAMQ